MYDFDHIASLLPFLSQVLGSGAEILLCDTEKILYAENPITARVKPGNRLGDMERSFMEDGVYRTCDSIVNYRALLPSRERLRASTFFLKDENGSLAGFFTINIQVEDMLRARDMLDVLINGNSPNNAQATTSHDGDPSSDGARFRALSMQFLNRYEGEDMSIEDLIQSITNKYLTQFGVSASRLTTAERQEIVRELDKRGVFLVKGSIMEVARQLGCSEATIYRYLQHCNT